MIILDGTIVNVTLPSIQDDLGFSQSSLAWVVNAYLIPFGGLLLAGRLGDLVGRKQVFTVGLAVFVAASALCGVAQSQEVLVGSVDRARDAGRFTETCVTQELATQFWVVRHGLTMLVLTGVLALEALDLHAPAIATALFVAASDDEKRCRRSVHAGWSSPRHALGAVP